MSVCSALQLPCQYHKFFQPRSVYVPVEMLSLLRPASQPVWFIGGLIQAEAVVQMGTMPMRQHSESIVKQNTRTKTVLGLAVAVPPQLVFLQ
jgi:hypothetical protein